VQDDAAAVQVVAPLALLIGCCRPFLTFGRASGPETWVAHLLLVLAYLAARLALSACPNR